MKISELSKLLLVYQKIVYFLPPVSCDHKKLFTKIKICIYISITVLQVTTKCHNQQLTVSQRFILSFMIYIPLRVTLLWKNYVKIS